MALFRHHSRLAWVAVAAIMGMLSVAGDASASTADVAPRGDIRSCCAEGRCTVCCCKPAEAPPRPRPADRSAALPSKGGDIAAPARPCECRSSEPATPAPKPESRSSEGRGDQARGEPVDPALDAGPPPAATFARLILPTSSPPKSPLYLRIARLLI
jgi:hypothetical protein